MDHYISTGFAVEGEVTEADRAEAFAAGLMIGPRDTVFLLVTDFQYDQLVGWLRKRGVTFQTQGLGADDEPTHGIAVGRRMDWDPD